MSDSTQLGEVRQPLFIYFSYFYLTHTDKFDSEASKIISHSLQVVFEWRHRSSEGGDPPLTCTIGIPNATNLDELAFRLIKEHGLPFYAKAG